MPSDFELSLNFSYYGKEEVNFYNNTITKDLIEGGLSTINFNSDDKILEDIYKKLKAQNIADINGNFFDLTGYLVVIVPFYSNQKNLFFYFLFSPSILLFYA